MTSRWYNTSVVLLWLATMGWLVHTKVMPALLIGEPPSYQTILEAQEEDPAVAWQMLLNDQEAGWALGTTMEMPNEMTEVRSLVRFDDFRVNEVAPPWVKGLLRDDGFNDLRLNMDVASSLAFDPLGRLSRFESGLYFDPKQMAAVKIRGSIDGDQLSLEVRAGDVRYENKMPVSQNAIMGDAFSPNSRLPGLHDGQTWTVEIYSPLRPSSEPIEVLQASVEGKQRIAWQGDLVETWLVVYRGDPGAVQSGDRPRGRTWVRPDGMVLKQEVGVFGAGVTFIRMGKEQVDRLADEFEALADDWRLGNTVIEREQP